MIEYFSKVMHIINPVLMAVFLAYCHGLASRMAGSPMRRNAVMGILFGVAAALAMASPIPLADGIIVDVRSLLIGLSGALFGVIGGIISFAIGAAVRLQIGGAGAASGVAGMLIAVSMGIFWAHVIRRRVTNTFFAYLLLGGMISFHMAAVFFLPPEVRGTFLFKVGPWLVTLNVVGTFIITSLISREERMLQHGESLAHAAATDPLTQLLNRRSAHNAYSAMPVSEKRDHGTAMLCFDVDHFKSINDTYGHQIGDKVLLNIAARINRCLRPDDVFSRMGGDEFMIVLPDVTDAEAERVAERCRAVVSASPFVFDAQNVDVTISMGANWSHQPGEFSAIFAKADAALYQAKSLGRNCVTFVGQHRAGRTA